MSQTTFLFDATQPAAAAPGAAPRNAVSAFAATAAGTDRTAFEIGWDFAHHRLTPPVAHLHADSPVRQGWSAGRAVFGARTLRPGRSVRQWLALRLHAWQHGIAVEPVQVTPHFIGQLQATHCLVTGQPLTDATDARGADSDGTLVRLNPRAAAAAGNLAQLSRLAAQAAALGCETALQRARQLDAHVRTDTPTGSASTPPDRIDGLDADAWARLALLASFATPLPHAVAAGLPLRVLPPNRVRVLNPVQALQVVLTMQFCDAGYARRLVAWAALMPGSEVRQAFQLFMHTLLARRLSAGPVLDDAAARRAMEAAWADALVQRRWQRLALLLTPAQCEQLLQRGARRGLLGAGRQWLAEPQATEGWALAAAGQASTDSCDGVVSTKALLSH